MASRGRGLFIYLFIYLYTRYKFNKRHIWSIMTNYLSATPRKPTNQINTLRVVSFEHFSFDMHWMCIYNLCKLFSKHSRSFSYIDSISMAITRRLYTGIWKMKTYFWTRTGIQSSATLESQGIIYKTELC